MKVPPVEMSLSPVVLIRRLSNRARRSFEDVSHRRQKPDASSALRVTSSIVTAVPYGEHGTLTLVLQYHYPRTLQAQRHIRCLTRLPRLRQVFEEHPMKQIGRFGKEPTII